MSQWIIALKSPLNLWLGHLYKLNLPQQLSIDIYNKTHQFTMSVNVLVLLQRSCCIIWYLAHRLSYFHTEFLTVFQLHLTRHIPSACSCIIHFIYTHPLHPMLFFKSSGSVTSWWDHIGHFSFIQLKSCCSPHYFTQFVKHVLDISFLFAKKGKWLDMTV